MTTPTGRCRCHSEGFKPSNKKKFLYGLALTEAEQELAKSVKIGSLEQEIRLFKLLLTRLSKKWDDCDTAQTKNMVALGGLVKELEEAHHRMTGGSSQDKPIDIIVAMRNECNNIDKSIGTG